jgi:hypothetical protein
MWLFCAVSVAHKKNVNLLLQMDYIRKCAAGRASTCKPVPLSSQLFGAPQLLKINIGSTAATPTIQSALLTGSLNKP